jgi:hypothetical protein
MKHICIILFLVFKSNLFFAQKNSYFTFKIQRDILKKGKTIATKIDYKTCFIHKNTSLEDFALQDTILVKTGLLPKNKQKKKHTDFEFRQNQEIDLTLKKNTLQGILKSDITQLSYLYNSPNEKKQLSKSVEKFSFPFKLNFKNKESQEFNFLLDSFTIKEKITLDFPTCITNKSSKSVGGIVSVYYRAALEHLNKNTYSTSSTGKILDFGHAFIGVKDLKTNKLHFLDGWPDAKWQEGNQHFTWNDTVDSTRTSDHHSISFNISTKDLATVVAQIENYRTACIEYKMLDFNCTDATTQILEKINLYTRKDQSNTFFPDSFANQLMYKLDKLKICYEYDGIKIR